MSVNTTSSFISHISSFSHVASRPDGIKKLRELILQLAVQGELVPPACRQAGKTPETLPAPEPRKWFVYVLECENGSFYKGFTTDLPKRWKAHKAGHATKHTEKHPPKQVFYWEVCYSEKTALKREKYLKSGSGREWFKREVVDNPDAWEPASALLEKIKAEKDRLVKEKIIKKGKTLPEIDSDDHPCRLPSNWAATRLGNSIRVLNGRAYKKHEMLNAGTPLLRVGNLFTSNEWYYSDLELEPDKYIDSGDLIYSWSASFGPFVWQGGRVIYHYHIWKLGIIAPSFMERDYIYRYLEAITDSIKASGHGVAMIHMTKEKMEKLILPIPPLAEQKRIVARVDQLMALCDKLEEQQTQRVEVNQKLAEASLNQLLTAASSSGDPEHAERVAQAWQRIADNFQHLFPATGSIRKASGRGSAKKPVSLGKHNLQKLRQTILQLAVQGKLVPQDPNDEPASVLLEKIKAEKKRLIKEKKIRKSSLLQTVEDGEFPYELPNGWQWDRLGNLGYTLGGGTPSKSNSAFWDGNIPWVSPKDMKVDYIEDSQDHISEAALTGSSVKSIPEGSLLMVIRGMILAHSFPAALTKIGVTVNQDMKALCPYHSMTQEFLLCSLKGCRDRILALVERSSHGTCRLESERLFLSVVGIPPLAEQKRIVARVDQLMTLCDKLEEGLDQSLATQQKLTNALIGELEGGQ